SRAGFNKHAEASLRLDQLLVDHFLISLENRKRIDPIFGRDIAHRRQRIAFFEHAVENHVDTPVAKLSINRLTVVPFTLHSMFHCASYGDIVNYNTSSQASFIFIFLGAPSPPRSAQDKELSWPAGANRPFHSMRSSGLPARRTAKSGSPIFCARTRKPFSKPLP